MMLFSVIAIVISLIVIYALIVTKPTVHLYYLVPVILICSISLYFFIKSLLGYPTDVLSKEKFSLIAYHVSEEKIFTWIIHDNETSPRAYEFPYTEERHAQLESAMETIQSGIAVQGEFLEDSKQGENVTSQSEKGSDEGYGTSKSANGLFHLYNIDASKYLPKKQ